MVKRSKFLQSCSALISDRGGNFALMAALIIPVLFAGGGVAMDMANMMMAKNQLQDAADTAALAASSALINEGMSIPNAKKLANDFLIAGISAQEGVVLDEAFSKNTKINIVEQLATNTVGNSKTYTVDISSSYNLPLNPLTRLLGKQTATISAASKSLSSSETKNALSMFLVLDRSGSMAEDTATINKDNPKKVESYSCGTKNNPKTCKRDVDNFITKIEALKTATENLTTYLKTADPTGSLVRTGAVSYNASMQKQTDLTWGTDSAVAYVKALSATGGTDSGDAFATAYGKLMLKKNNVLVEDDAHFVKNKQAPTKYIVFMTDGDNNYTSADTETKKWCDKAKADNIQVFTVAFMAPTRGQTLLNSCATTSAHYFKAENAEQLNEAFKYIGEKASAMTVRLTQ
ncbi:vWA domain-containing protein [Rhizobium sp. PL01]|uniref:vWA domain-containing protein n=1 Tax=Rhizobium sp. PL01 TaxID=3085631 RepID=UPI0029813C11|nr:VWA domain-containing protein [Rhizobium sp. PL01]MDW5314737.1 VWA domain-containing protein [Rhizobium sp. PL01]